MDLPYPKAGAVAGLGPPDAVLLCAGPALVC